MYLKLYKLANEQWIRIEKIINFFADILKQAWYWICDCWINENINEWNMRFCRSEW
jgi:hypothetical protein